MEIACNLKTDTNSVRGTVRVSKLSNLIYDDFQMLFEWVREKGNSQAGQSGIL